MGSKQKISIAELKELIREVVKEDSKTNAISLGGVEVHSSNQSLKQVQRVAQSLIDRNSDFLLARNKLKTQTNYAG